MSVVRRVVAKLHVVYAKEILEVARKELTRWGYRAEAGRHGGVFLSKLSRLVVKPSMWFWNRSDTNQAVQKTHESLKFQIEEEEGLYFPSSENKCLFYKIMYIIIA